MVFESDKTGEIIREIAEKFQLEDKTTWALADQVTYTLVGLLNPEQFHDSVMRELNLRPSETDEIVNEVDEKIFQHIRSDLNNLARGGAPKFTDAAQTPPTPHPPTPAIIPNVPAHAPDQIERAAASSLWNIPLNPVVTEATPMTPRTLSTPSPQKISPEPVPQPLQPKSAAPLPPPPKEELVVPHKSGSQHTSNMPGMRHPWLSDPIKLPSTVAPTPGSVKEVEKKGLTEKPKVPTFEKVSASTKTEIITAPSVSVATKPESPNISSIPQPIQQRAPMPASTPSIVKPLTSTTPLQKTSAPAPANVSVPLKPHISEPVSTKDITSTEVIMPGKGVNIPIPKMVSRLPIEERDASRITIVRKQVTEAPKTITTKVPSTPADAPISPVSSTISPSAHKTSNNSITRTTPTPVASATEAVKSPIKIPTPGAPSHEVVRPEKTPITPPTPDTPIYQGGKDPYREPVS